jgi:hypothetical protein
MHVSLSVVRSRMKQAVHGRKSPSNLLCRARTVHSASLFLGSTWSDADPPRHPGRRPYIQRPVRSMTRSPHLRTPAARVFPFAGSPVSTHRSLDYIAAGPASAWMSRSPIKLCMHACMPNRVTWSRINSFYCSFGPCQNCIGTTCPPMHPCSNTYVNIYTSILGTYVVV